MQILISQTSVVASKQFRGCSRALSLDNLPHINQRREVEADHRAALARFGSKGRIFSHWASVTADRIAPSALPRRCSLA